MTKNEQVIARLQAGMAKVPPPAPSEGWGIRERLAVALMRADGQVKCQNCKQRLRPCRRYVECKADGADFKYFDPKDALMERQLGRVNCIIDELKRTEL